MVHITQGPAAGQKPSRDAGEAGRRVSFAIPLLNTQPFSWRATLTRFGGNSSVGAGDTFVAGMLYGLICQADTWDVTHKLGFAVALATLKVQREGFDGLGNDIRMNMQRSR